MLREVELVHVPTSEQLVDIFIKALGKNQFKKMRLKLQVMDNKHNTPKFEAFRIETNIKCTHVGETMFLCR